MPLHRVQTPEEKLTMAVADLLKINGHEDWDWTHFPAGENRTGKTGAKLKRMGLKRGWPDFILVSPKGQWHCLELKRDERASLSPEQKAFRARMEAKGTPYKVARSFSQAMAVLLSWGALKRNMRVAA